MSPEAIWNAQLQDVQCAVAWVRANAEQYRVDTTRIALMGRSAGAHLALEAAYRPNDATVDLAACGMAGVDTSVSAVVAFYPPTDLRMWDSTPEGALAALLGGLPADMPDVYADASPTEFVRDDLPPTLLLQGYMDDLVVPAHVELLHNLLLATNTPVVVLRVPWARHGFDFLIGGLGAQMVEYDIDRFLAWSFYRID
ncbi:MAG: alpha/beta hydrolase [Anaerolineae bacterium]